MSSTPSAQAESDPALNDLGPLAWVLDELRKSLDGATKAMHRFVRDADLARGSNLSELDTSHLRVARQQLHQAVGALEMVGMQAPAKLLHAMEAAVQKFVQRPELCSEDAATRIERASFALAEYLEGVLKGRQASSVALFPQYRAVMELSGAERIHPADLWAQEWRWLPVVLAPSVSPLSYAPEVRAKLDHSVLKIVKTADAHAASKLAQVCVGLSAGHSALESHSFWAIAAGYFQAMGLALLPTDLYTKRTASRILQQYAALAKGEPVPGERLAQDLVFFCSQAQPAPGQSAAALNAVRAAYGVADAAPVDYETAQFGRFDPAQLALARKRIASAAETWSALAGGDTNRLKLAGEQFAAVAESILKLHPAGGVLAQALTGVVEASVRSGVAPTPEVAMEVATSILYLEAAYEDLDPTDDRMVERGTQLALRLQHVRDGAEPEPLEDWMEELYRRVSDRQTMGSVVDELRTSLGEVETALDQFFRNPADKAPLREVPARLAQMRGVFSVLGLDQPSIATLRMRDSVDRLMADAVDVDAARKGVFERLGNSLGALGLLIDMLSYQRAMAKKLFVYDDAAGEFRPLMGRARSAEVPAVEALGVASAADAGAMPEPLPELALPAVAMQPLASAEALAELALPAALAPASVPAASVPAAPLPTPVPVSTAAEPEDEDDDELQDIFLEEARDVVSAGLAALAALQREPANLAEQTTLRRAFHTLKGSSRMVGLNDFGEAAWAFEQLLNAWLAEQKPASADLLSLCGSAMPAFGRWIEDIAGQTGAAWHTADFRKSADALRLQGQLQPLPGSAAEVASTPVVAALLDAAPVAEFVAEPAVEPLDESVAEPVVEPLAEPAAEPVLAELPDFAATRLPSEDDEQALPAPLAEPELELPDFVSTQVFSADAEDAAVPDFQATQSFDSEATQVLPRKPQAAAPLDLGDFDFGDVGLGADPLAPVADANATQDIALDFPPEPAPLVLDLPELDTLTSDADLLAPDALATQDDLADADDVLAGLDLPEDAETAAPAPAPAEPHAPESDEQTKVIGDLRMSIALYNVYLNEADEWSRRLITELGEWALELHRPVPSSAVALAHSLGGSSATVGFTALSEVARTLEHALEHVKLHGQGTPQQAQVFSDAAEDIRRLLHQFAAGFLKPADALVLEALRDIIATEFAAPATLDAQDTHAEDLLDELELPDFELASETLAAETQAPQTLAALPLELPEPEPEIEVESAPEPETEEAEPPLDAVDHLDVDLFPIFQEEATELMPALGTALRQWVARPDNRGARSEALRVLHTLKGSARLAGALRLGEMAHRLESSIESLGTEDLKSDALEPLLARMDALQHNLDALDLAPREDISQPPAASVPVEAAAPAADAEPAATAVATVSPVVSVEQVTRSTPRNAGGQSVRVRSQLLDRLVTQAGEVMISRSRMEARVAQMRSSLGDLTGNLERMRQHLRNVEVQAESQMQSRMALSKDEAQDFDPLEFDRFTRMQELTRMLAESVNDVATVQRGFQRAVEGAEDDLVAQGRQARELQRDLLRTRMVEFESISERLYGVVRQSAKESGKQVKLSIVGGTIEMDRGVLERMTPAFEHILRNAVAHGVEDAALREAAGKPAMGTITVTLQQESNDVSVSFADDGAGLQLDKIRAKAVANKLIAPDAVLSEEAAAKLLFAPGFSTASEVTELSGRGIGMDVVLTELNALGGRVETHTSTGKGTTFRLVLPLTTAVTQVVMLRMGEFSMGVPSNLMETVLRAPLADVEAAYQRGSYELAGQLIPFFWGGALLQVSGRSQEPQTRNLPVAVFRSAGQRLALHVDEVLGNREVVVKNLGPQLARLPGLAGMSVLASGAVVLIYNPVALATVYGEAARALSATAEVQQAAGSTPEAKSQAVSVQAPLVLVVDDSITVRRVTQRLLKREGFRVALANDGLHALEVLAQEKPAVVLSDIEMPRMDGFDLVRNIRADAQLRDLPVIMITSRIAQKHRDLAEELGVDHYLGKPYAEDALLALIRGYCAQTVEE